MSNEHKRETTTEIITHNDLVRRGAEWLRRHHNCGVVLTEYHSRLDAVPDVIGFGYRGSVVIECKASRSDFFADKNKSHRSARVSKQLGNYRYYLTSPDIVTSEDIPEGWGLLYIWDKLITVEVHPVFHEEPEIRVAEYSILYSLVRRAEIRGMISEIMKPLETDDITWVH